MIEKTHLRRRAVPTLFRFLFILGLIAGAGFAVLVAFAFLVEPEPREMTIPVISDSLKVK
jgi:hypothetical protein